MRKLAFPLVILAAALTGCGSQDGIATVSKAAPPAKHELQLPPDAQKEIAAEEARYKIRVGK